MQASPHVLRRTRGLKKSPQAHRPCRQRPPRQPRRHPVRGGKFTRKKTPSERNVNVQRRFRSLPASIPVVLLVSVERGDPVHLIRGEFKSEQVEILFYARL